MATANHQVWQRAVSYAAQRHEGQYRKDKRTPYVAHPFRVAMVVRHVFGESDETAIVAALLHDLIEDTTTDYDDLIEQFGQEVANCVAALTKDARLPEEQREEAYNRQLERAPWQARLVKLADVYDNYCDSSSDGQRKNFVWKAERAIKCAGSDPKLQAAVKIVRELVG